MEQLITFPDRVFHIDIFVGDGESPFFFINSGDNAAFSIADTLFIVVSGLHDAIPYAEDAFCFSSDFDLWLIRRRRIQGFLECGVQCGSATFATVERDQNLDFLLGGESEECRNMLDGKFLPK